MADETGSSGGVDQEGSLDGAIRNALNKAYPGGDQGVDAKIEKIRAARHGLTGTTSFQVKISY